MRVVAEREETFGERVRRLRLERGLSQRQLAGEGLTNAYISRIERGTRANPSMKALRVLARGLNVSPEYLETGVQGSAERRRWLLGEAELELRLRGQLEAAERKYRDR